MLLERPRLTPGIALKDKPQGVFGTIAAPLRESDRVSLTQSSNFRCQTNCLENPEVRVYRIVDRCPSVNSHHIQSKQDGDANRRYGRTRSFSLLPFGMTLAQDVQNVHVGFDVEVLGLFLGFIDRIGHQRAVGLGVRGLRKNLEG